MSRAVRRKEPRGKVEADVVLGQIPPESVGLEIVHKLAAKGFCVVSPGFEDEILSKALDEIEEFEMLGRWTKVNSIIQDGLLGSEGSCQIAELESPDLDDEVRSDGEMLMKLDYTITHVGFRMEPYLDSLSIEISHRSLAIVHQTGEPDEEATPPLNEKFVMKWMAQFMRHRIMVCIFLGPTPGTLELLPYNTEDTEVHELQTQPGMIVILRPDLMSHKHYSPGRSIAISSFFLAGHISRRTLADVSKMIPPARELDEWSMNRLMEMKESSLEDAIWRVNIPRDWQHAMNHMFHSGQMIGVRSSAMKCCMHDDISTLWQVATCGPDYVTDVPLLRWDHTEIFDPDMESWRIYKSYCRHASFMDGIELFDCKMFSMSPNEAKVMDPHQRLILEIGYASLHNAGLRKNTLVNTACGVYVGCGNTEWGTVPKEESGAFGATGGALSISSGRFSFTLGLKGPSMTLDTEASSGSTAVHLSADSLEKKGRAATNEWSVAIGAHILLSALYWPNMCAMGSLSSEGRCFTFNATAAGFVRGDGVAACTLKLSAENVDDDFIHVEDNTTNGMLAGSTMNNNGKGASLTAPSGPAEQEAISDAVLNANISVFDIDHVEAFGAGGFLADAIEVGSLIRAHRTEEVKEPLCISSLKSSIGNQLEPSGIIAFCRTIQCGEWGIMTPNLHLRQCNPHIESFDQPTAFVTQCTEYRMQSSFAGNMSRGNGGSNVYLLSWAQLNHSKFSEPYVPGNREVLTFWPGGGGQLDTDKRPSREYTIVGSWGQWPDPQPMEPQGDGTYTYTMTLGENMWEWFVIWLDGDPTRVLHPGYPKASKDFPVLGPVEDAEGACWMVNGHVETVFVPLDQTENVADGAFEIMTDEFGQQVASYHVPTADAGRPGDQYRITLRVAGKWRTVTWERIKALTDDYEEDAPLVSLPALGMYYICSDWNGWDLDPFSMDEHTPCLWYQEIKMKENQHEFQIVRNRDFSQVLYPSEPDSQGQGRVMGPDDGAIGYSWLIKAPKDTVMRIEFYRVVDDTGDHMKVCWRRPGEDLPSAATSLATPRSDASLEAAQ